MKFFGSENLSITKEGKLKIETPLGFIEEDAPFTYQEESGTKIMVGSSFQLSENTVSFNINKYNKNSVLVIDPIRSWSTFTGGNSNDYLYDLFVDKFGNSYIVSQTSSTNFPVTSGAFQSSNGGYNDALISKFDSAGKHIWSTYYGGSGEDLPYGVTLDKDGNIIFSGRTESSNFPVTSNAYQNQNKGSNDAFLVKLNRNGVRRFSTYLGGTGDDWGISSIADSKKNIYISGKAGSINFPVSSSAYQSSKKGGDDGFVSSFDSAGNLRWSTYFGGSNDEFIYWATIDNKDNIIITGTSSSTNFPVTSGVAQTTNSGGRDGILIKFDTSGALKWSTYLGGTSDDLLYDASTDTSGNIYVSGFSYSSNFPVTSGAFQNSLAGGGFDGIIIKFNSSGSKIWATYYGGNGTENLQRISSDAIGNIFVSGWTESTNFPITSDAYQKSLSGARDAVYITFNPQGSRQWSTYYGGKSSEVGTGFTSDAYGNFYLVGYTNSSDFPVSSNPFQNSISGLNDGFIVKFSSDKPIITASGPLTFCAGDSVTLSTAIPYSSYKWSHGPTTRNVKITTSGKYAVAVKDANNITTVSDTITVITNPKPKANFYFTNNCQGQLLNFFDSTIITSGTLTYSWELGDGRTSTLKDVSVIYNTPGTYNVKLSVSSNNGCKDSITKQVSVFANPKADFNVTPQVCEGNTLSLINNSIIPANTNVSYLWNFGDGNTSTQTTPVHNYQTSGTYNIKLLIVTQYGCKDSVIKQITVQPKPIANFNFTNVCSENPATLSDSSVISNGNLIYKWYFGDGGTSTDQNPVYTFKNPGNYNVSLTVTSTVGCKDSVSKIITVYPQPIKPIISVNGSASFCEGDSATLNAGTGYASYLWSTGDTSQSIIVRQSGNYTVKVTNVNGCMDSALAIKITAHPRNFNLSFTESQRILSTSPFSVVFTNTTPDAGKYDFTWKFGDGKTSTQESPIYSYQDSGLYTITLIAKNKSTGCIDSIVKKDWIYIVKTSGIYNFENILPEIIIYPNPTDASFSIDFINNIEKEMHLILFDGLGKKVFEKHLKPDVSQKILTLDISNSPKGIYFLRVTSEKSGATYKVIKQ